MKIETTGIEGLLIIKPQVFGDHRGYFSETFRKDKMHEAGCRLEFVQDNQSKSKKHILRGLHFQAPPHDQGKLVQVVKGAVIDVAVDIRSNSKTYGQHYAIELTEDNKYQFYVPPGFAHGFVTLQDDTIFCYKCTNYYNKESEGSIRWNSPELDIDWGVESPILSEKDDIAPLFKEFKTPF